MNRSVAAGSRIDDFQGKKKIFDSMQVVRAARQPEPRGKIAIEAAAAWLAALAA